MKNLLFAPFSKVEELADGTVQVFGIASSESEDSDGEIVKADAVRDALPDWLDYGNIREMHQPIAAGVAIEASVDDAGVTHLGAHIVDMSSVAKVKAGVLKGFSLGGAVLQRNKANKKIIEVLKINEISLVDRPANPDARITLVKLDKQGRAITGKRKTVPASDDIADAAAKTEEGDDMKKGMYDVGTLARVITDLHWLWRCAVSEKEMEGDKSTVPDTLKDGCMTLCTAIRDMVDEETAELLGLDNTGDEDMLDNAAKKIKADDLTKAHKLNKSAMEAASGVHEHMQMCAKMMGDCADKMKKFIAGGEPDEADAGADDGEGAKEKDKKSAKKNIKAVDLSKADDSDDEEGEGEGQGSDLMKSMTKLMESNVSLTERALGIAEQAMAKGSLKIVGKDGKTEDAEPTNFREALRKSYEKPVVVQKTASA